jgi:NitT/TauT family transport system substrate-binding protein
MPMKNSRRAKAAVFSAALCAWVCAGSAAAEKIRTAIPSASIHYLSVYVAEERGFFKEENLENEVIAIGGPAGIAALVNGGIDFSGAAGSGMRAAIAGAAIKVIMFQTEKVTWYLVTGPNVARITDLRGKRVGVFALSDTSDTLVTRFFAGHGLAAADFTRIALGTSPGTIIAALKSGAVDAATLDPASIVRAEREGMRTLAFLGDMFPYPFQGFAVTEKKIAENPGQIRRWLRAMIRSLILIRDNVDGATDVALKRLRYEGYGRALVAEGIRRYIKALPQGVPGLPSPDALKTVIEYDVRTPMKLKEEIPVERLMNVKFVEEVRAAFEGKRNP